MNILNHHLDDIMFWFFAIESVVIISNLTVLVLAGARVWFSWMLRGFGFWTLASFGFGILITIVHATINGTFSAVIEGGLIMLIIYIAGRRWFFGIRHGYQEIPRIMARHKDKQRAKKIRKRALNPIGRPVQ